jgi:hypothetical protein
MPMRSLVSSALLAAAFVLAPAVAGAAPASSKSPFTVTNDPVEGTVADVMMQRTCTGTLVPIWWSHMSNQWIQATFWRKPDGTKWVKVSYNGKGPVSVPVIEIGVSAQWTTPPERYAHMTLNTLYVLWPDGDNRLRGTTVDPYGTVDLTCE